MTAIAVKGWCPSLYAPMASGDGLLVRVRPAAATLTAAAARALAGAAARHGNGVVELTNRGSLQLRGLSAESLPAFTAAMLDAGLAGPDAAVERRRRVIASPLAGDDPGVSRHAARIAESIETLFANDPELAALPDKFGIAVDGGGVLPLAGVAADIRIVLQSPPFVTIDGARDAVACAPGDAADIARRLALGFLALAPRPRRMRALVAEHGAAAVFAAAGLVASVPALPCPAPVACGWLPYPGTARGAFGIGLPFGATDTAGLQALAGLAERDGDGTLRLTPWRAVVIASVTAPDAVRRIVDSLGLIAAATDPRGRIAACPGHPACASATVATRADAARLAALGLPGTLHVSGCAKGCAHPAAADTVLVGESGRYSLLRQGRAGDVPALQGLTIAQAIDALRQPRTPAA